MLDLLFFVLGFVPLIIGANLLVDSASSLAKRMNIPAIVIGMTIVAFGTSAPELVVNVFASVEGNSGITLGNVLGSNIFNIFAILGISAAIYPLAVKTATTWIEIPLAILAAAALFAAGNDAVLGDGVSVISRGEGILLLLFFCVFLAYSFRTMKSGEYEEEIPVKSFSPVLSVFLIAAGIALLAAGGRIIVANASSFARSVGVSERIIGLTIVSIGTSLPELATSAAAAVKKNVDIAIGNIVGSNIFNTFFILGISAVIRPVPVSASSLADQLVNLAAGVLLFVFVFTGKGRSIERFEGFIFLAGYAGYLAFLLVTG